MMDDTLSPAPDWGAWEANGNMAPPSGGMGSDAMPLVPPAQLAILRAKIAAMAQGNAPSDMSNPLQPDGDMPLPPGAVPTQVQAAAAGPELRNALGSILPAFSQSDVDRRAALAGASAEPPLVPSPMGAAPAPAPASPAPQAASDRASGNYDVTTPAAAPASPQASVTTPSGAPSGAPSPKRLAAMSAPYQMGAGYYDLVHAGEGDGVNPITQATGPVQVIPRTAALFHASPGNANVDLTTADGANKFTKWYGDQNAARAQSVTGQPATNGQVLAGHLLGPDGMASLLEHPNDPAGKYLSPAVFANNPSALPGGPTATGAQTIAGIAAYYGGAKGGSGSPGVVSASMTSQTSPVQSGGGATDPRLAGLMDLSRQQPLPYPVGQMTMQGAPLLALAGGILSGHGLGDGLGRGLTAMSQVQQADVHNKMAANQLTMEMNRLGIQQQYQNSLLGIRHQTADNSTLRTQAATDPTQVAAIASAKGSAALDAKQAGADAEEIIDGGRQAVIKNQQLDAIQKILDSGQATPGPGINAVKRQIGNLLGVNILGSEPQANQLLANAVSAERGSGIMGKNMRTQREFNSIMEGLGNVDQQGAPALQQVVTSLRNINAMKTQLGTAWDGLSSTQQAQYRRDPDALNHWYTGVLHNWDSQVKQGGGLYSDKDPHTGLGFTIH